MSQMSFFYPLPTEGDIVWCYFPLFERLGNPGPKARPALVISVSDAHSAVEVVYGTTQKTRLNEIRSAEFVMDPHDSGFADSGLAGRTKFNFDRSVKLPFTSDWFSVAPGFSIYSSHRPLPKMGVMHVSYRDIALAAFKNKSTNSS